MGAGVGVGVVWVLSSVVVIRSRCGNSVATGSTIEDAPATAAPAAVGVGSIKTPVDLEGTGERASDERG